MVRGNTEVTECRWAQNLDRSTGYDAVGKPIGPGAIGLFTPEEIDRRPASLRQVAGKGPGKYKGRRGVAVVPSDVKTKAKPVEKPFGELGHLTLTQAAEKIRQEVRRLFNQLETEQSDAEEKAHSEGYRRSGFDRSRRGREFSDQLVQKFGRPHRPGLQRLIDEGCEVLEGKKPTLRRHAGDFSADVI